MDVDGVHMTETEQGHGCRMSPRGRRGSGPKRCTISRTDMLVGSDILSLVDRYCWDENRGE